MNPSEVLRRAKELYKEGEAETAREAVDLAYEQATDSFGGMADTGTERELLKPALDYLRDATSNHVTRLFDRAIALADEAERSSASPRGGGLHSEAEESP